MKRREFITLVGGAAATWPLAARAQRAGQAQVVGFLYAGSPASFTDRLAAFRQGLKESGYVEGENLAVEYRWAEGQYERLPIFAAEFVRNHVAAIAAVGTEAPALAAKNATTTIPIVFQIGGDPVATGLVGSLNHPGGNVTGVTRVTVEIAAKSLELLHQLLPNAREIALLVNPATPEAEQSLRNVQNATHVLGLHEVHVVHASSTNEIEPAIAAAAQLQVGALLINTDSVFNSDIGHVGALTLRHRLPAFYSTREFAAAGGLISYGASLPDQYRQVGAYVGRILAGAKPSELPVLQPTRFDLVINLNTAKTLGIIVPQTLLVGADEVIE